MHIPRPSPGTILGAVALFVALGGTALAATGTVVNIADPTTAANKAKVDTTGALKTAGTATVSGFVGETIPKTPLFGHQYLSRSVANVLIGANKATVALARLDLANYYDQTNGAAVDIRVVEQSGSTTTCDGSTGSQAVGTYEVPAGQTVSDAIASPVVLKPLVSGDVWCLLAFVAVQGGPGSYFLPEASFSGYVAAGTLPSGAVAAPAGAGALAPRHVTG
jgi:hypothetical protein